MKLAVTSPYDKPGLFEISLSEASDEHMLSNYASSGMQGRVGGKVAMIPTSSFQKSKAVSMTD